MSKNKTESTIDKKPTTDFDSVLKKIRDESENTAELGTRFENLIKDYFETDKLYKNRFVKVWKWMEWPDREGPDIGIDLVAEEDDGSYCAIQCKCYADDGSLDERHVTNFLAYADGLKKFKNKILAYTGEHITNHANTILKKHKCSIIDKEHLRASSIDWGDFPKIRVKEPFTLFDYQENALNDVLTGFEKNDRGKMIMACGTGKTLVSLHVAENTAGKAGLVLFLVPSISLILQSMREWSDNANMKHYYVAVCSDKSAGEEGSITELESKVSTDAEALKQSLKNRPKDAMTVVFSTYHSIEVVKKAIGNESFDIIFSDEAHRTTGVEEKSFFTFVHSNKNIRSKKRLYMTATPRIYNDKIKAHVGEALASMDDEKKYGPEFHKLNFTDAVRKYDALSDFKVKIAIVPEDKVDQEFQQSVMGKDMSMPLDERTLLAAVWDGIQFPEDGEGEPQLLQRVIAFSNRIDRSQMFAGEKKDKNDNSRSFESVVNQYNKKSKKRTNRNYGTGNKVEVKHVDGSTNAITRREKMRWLSRSNEDSKTCRILSNARCLSEGVDVPALDGVVFLNPRKSVVDVVQSVGRVMRKAQDKKYGYVILPVAIPAGITPHEALDSNDTFKVVWQVLNALRSHDEMFAKEINSLILDKKTEVTGPVTSRISVSILDDDGQEGPPITKLFDKIKSKLIQKVGDFNYYQKYGEKLGKASSTVEVRIRNMLKSSSSLEKEHEKFCEDLKEIINESITKDEAIRVISQHVILSRVFDELFSGEFTSHNPISIELNKMAGKFGLNEELEELEDFYVDVKKEVAEIKTGEARQNFIKTIYGNFFASTAKKETEQHGVVYTPVEVIDFIIQSVEQLLHEHFDMGFNTRSVKVLDPFTGTGTFLTRLLESGLITTNLSKKYKHDLFANELILLAYYIATVNIETTYSKLTGKKYVPFEGISYTDTLRLNAQYRKESRHRQEDRSLDDTFKIAHERIRNQRGSHVHVIMGNPPYSAGQSEFSDNNPNIKYPEIDNRIKETYSKKSTSRLQSSLYDSYVRSFRWASDRMGDSGIIAFITNASFLRTSTGSGIRACLEEEFNEVWCFDLRGNQKNTQGETSRKEGGKIFGSGSRAPVAILILIKNPNQKTHIIHYKDIGDSLTREQKLKIIKDTKSIEGIKGWEKIKSDDNYDWIDKQINTFSKYLQIGSSEAKAGKVNAVFNIYSPGVGTARDAWVYNFSKEEISKNMKRMIDYCNKQNLKDKKLDKKIHDLTQVSWSTDLFKRLKNPKKLKPVFDKKKIQVSLYRPFFKQYLYYDKIFNERPGLMSKIFPNENSENIAICVPSHGTGKKFSTIITNVIPNGDCLEHTQCYPLYTYDEFVGGDSKNKKKENITEDTLQEYRTFYSDKKISKEDIFYYVYGLLHHPGYREKYENNLSKDFARIPMAPKFNEFTKAGRNLAKLHLNYENGKKYNLGKPKNTKFGKLKKLSFGGKTINEKGESQYSEILINTFSVFDKLPKINYRVSGRTPLEWVVDRYNVSTDKKSKIINQPGDEDIISIIERTVYVGVESDKIIKQLPDEFEPKHYIQGQSGLEQFA
jgi:predicted helicase